MEDMSGLPHLFIQLFISTSMDSWIIILFRVIIQNYFIHFFVQIVPGSSCILLALALDLAITTRPSGSFYWRMLLKSKIWV